MLTHNQAKFVNALKLKKYRLQHAAFIVEGEKGVGELLLSQYAIVRIFAISSWIYENSILLEQKQCEVIEISNEDLSKISDLSTPNKVLAVAQLPKAPILEDFFKDDLVLALDGIRDPGNLGTIIRTANWFGINKIVCSPDCVDAYNPKVIQSTMGSFAKVDILYHDLSVYFSSLSKDIPVYGALLEGPGISNKLFTKRGVILIGSESHGIAGNLLPYVNNPVYIPHFTVNTSIETAESLNASIACAIICYEITKQLFSK